jgi:glycosyltransferase involved in cell wall biosynthesis
MAPGSALRVAVDMAPLRGAMTGVGQAVAGLLDGLRQVPQVEVAEWSLTRERWPVPPRLLVRAWARVDRPRGDRWLPDADVVHGSNFVVPPTRRPSTVTVHDLWCIEDPSACDRTVAAAGATVARAAGRGAWLHVTTAWAAERVQERYRTDRVAVVPFACPAVPEAGPSPVEGPYVLAIGSDDVRKGFDVLVRAAAQAGVRVVLAGAPGPSTPVVDAVARAVGCDLVRLGRVDDATRAALLRGAWVLAYPSRHEGFGLPALEAMSVGVPVVTTRCGGTPEVVGDAALLADVDDVAGLAEALRAAWRDDGERSRLIEAGHDQVARYSWRATAEGMASLWRRAAEAG